MPRSHPGSILPLAEGKELSSPTRGSSGPSDSITGLVGGERREQTRVLLRGEDSASDSAWGGLSSSVTWPLRSGVCMYCQYPHYTKLPGLSARLAWHPVHHCTYHGRPTVWFSSWSPEWSTCEPEMRCLQFYCTCIRYNARHIEFSYPLLKECVIFSATFQSEFSHPNPRNLAFSFWWYRKGPRVTDKWKNKLGQVKMIISDTTFNPAVGLQSFQHKPLWLHIPRTIQSTAKD